MISKKFPANLPAALVIAALIFPAKGGPVMGSCSSVVVFEESEIIYENPLSDPEDIRGIVIESSMDGQPVITFPDGRMRLESSVHFLLWFPPDFPDNISVSWDFLPQTDDGLAMFWFSAKGRAGEDLFDPSLQKRTGVYSQYNRGDINAYHLAYFRMNRRERGFRTVNLRKSYGFELVARGGNPIPCAGHAEGPYRIKVIKYGPRVRVSINGLTVIDWKDGSEYWTEGKIGFRQMANLAAEYSNLRVARVSKPGG